MTTLTTLPDEFEAESSEQPVAAMVSPEARAARRISRFFTWRSLADQVGHVDGHGTGRTAGGAGPAVPTFVNVHVGLAVVRVDRQRVERTDVDAQRAAFEAQGLVDRHRHIGTVVDQR